MGRHKTKEEWIYWFKKYESGNFRWEEFYKTCSIKIQNRESCDNVRKWFRRKLREYNKGNEFIIISMTGKSKGSKKGRPKKQKEITWDDFTREELIEIAKRYKEITKDKNKDLKDQEMKSFNFSMIKIAFLLSVSRSSLYYQKRVDSKRNKHYEQLIIKAFYANHRIFGRDRIAVITGLNYRLVGRYMKALGLECKVRKARRKSEKKQTNVKFKDLVQRAYNSKGVIATDVSYINTNNGFNYLSIAIDHYSKKIVSWNFERDNTNELVLKHFKDMDLSGMIVHSDHGYQYSSNDFCDLSKEKGFKISMSRVGNSLDNREAEYFFSNLKSEWLKHLPPLSYEKTKEEIKKYIDWYNNNRPQSILKWKTPEQFAQMSL